ncbi:chromosome segregation protein ParM [Pectobacterium carotovorum]|uniref:Chromosome segregation protein ParM n=1 Tax=Pectobacterium carotovorum TaxID=554 RepID=A0A419AUC5_PECCA|nr:chromosome segregation protein ParM [Pectobacterium carotovorum]
MRISKNQQDILFLLYAIEQIKGECFFVPVTKLFNMVENNRHETLYANHFRTSCHTLNRHGLIQQRRSDNLKLFFSLTPHGRDIAAKIYNARKE